MRRIGLAVVGISLVTAATALASEVLLSGSGDSGWASSEHYAQEFARFNAKNEARNKCNSRHGVVVDWIDNDNYYCTTRELMNGYSTTRCTHTIDVMCRVRP